MHSKAIGMVALAVLLILVPNSFAQTSAYNHEIQATVYDNHIHLTLTANAINPGLVACIKNSFDSSAVKNQLSNLFAPYGLRVYNFTTPSFGSQSLTIVFDAYYSNVIKEPVTHTFLIFSWQAGTKYHLSLAFLNSLRLSYSCSSGGFQGSLSTDFAYANKPIPSWTQPDSSTLTLSVGNDFAHIGVDKPWWFFWENLSISASPASNEIIYSVVGLI